MNPVWIIEKKRDGNTLSENEIRQFISGYVQGQIADAQMAALAMAIFFRGMDEAETAALTDAMMHSGDLIDTSRIMVPKVDKHSTGGIGDKVSLILAPLMAAAGLAVPMISGRGLGITGGTLDKLESIPGFRTDLSESEFLSVVEKCGCAISGQTSNLVPADKKIYALRDITATVPSIPLIVSSIMSKKLAEGIDALVLDVKVGKGAFMKDQASGRELARQMVAVGSKVGKRVSALLTSMNEPLGRAVGNWLEVEESFAALRGKGPEDLMEVTFELGAEMLRLSGKVSSRVEGIALQEKLIQSGSAAERFLSMVEAQGGDCRIFERGSAPAAFRHEELSQDSGFIAGVDAEQIGKACVLLGAGRTRPGESISPRVGITQLKKCGEKVSRYEQLATIHADTQDGLNAARELVAGAFTLVSDRPRISPLVLERIGSEDALRSKIVRGNVVSETMHSPVNEIQNQKGSSDPLRPESTR